MSLPTLLLGLLALSLIGGVVILLWFIITYNSLVRLRAMVNEAWSGIEVQLKRRANVIPRLVELARTYMEHERALLEEITRIRAESLDVHEVKARGAVEENLSEALKQLLVRVEAYPDLKSDAQFLDLHKQLVEVEDYIQMARRYYNGSVRNLNIKVESFPSLLVAALMRFKKREYFSLESARDIAVPELR